MRFTVPQIMQFILQHYDRARDWDASMLFNWICWNIEQGFLFLTGDDKLTGILIARTTMNPQDCVGSLDHDPEGDTYFIDLAIAINPKRESLQALAFDLLRRFGQRYKLAFQRQGTGPVIVTDAHLHRKKLLRILHHGHTIRS